MDDFLNLSQSSVSSACKASSKIKGAYRFLKNNRVSLDQILESHVQSTLQRIEPEQILLNLQDTSGLNFHYHNSKEDRGHIGTSPQNKDSLGYWLHTGLLCSADGVPLGISSQEFWSRHKVNREYKDAKKSRLRKIPIEEKESYKWLSAVKECDAYTKHGAQLVQVCDREADIFEFMQHCLSHKQSFVIRAKSDRKVTLPTGENQHLFSCLKRASIQANLSIDIEGNSARKAKTVDATVKFRKVTLEVPVSNRSAEMASKMSPIDVTLIEVYSSSKIEGKKLHWRILTDINIEKTSKVLEIIKWYTLRWRIEIFFKTLKSGAKVEDSRLIDLDRLSKYVLMQSLTAFRVMQLLFASRSKHYSSIKSLLSHEEWIIFKRVLFPNKGRASERTSEWIKRIAQYGGFMKGKSRIPGVLTLWKGWKDLNTILNGVKALGLTGKF